MPPNQALHLSARRPINGISGSRRLYRSRRLQVNAGVRRIDPLGEASSTDLEWFADDGQPVTSLSLGR